MQFPYSFWRKIRHDVSSAEKSMSGWDRAFYLFFCAFAVVTLLTFRDYGYSWDEAWQNRWYGQAVLRFFSTFGKDLGSVKEYNFHLYGGTFDVLAEWIVNLSPFEPRNARHLANLLAGLLCLWGTWKTARHIGGAAAGFWSALFLAVTAPFYGHLFINAKDIPFAAGYIWSLYLLLRIAPQLPKPPMKDRLLLGLTLGLTLGVRIGGVLIVCYYLCLGLRDLYGTYRQRRRIAEIYSRTWSFIKASLPILGTGYLLMLVFWPAAILSPLRQPIEAFKASNHFIWGQTILWNGQQVSSTNLPWSYLPVLLAVELPEVLVILVLVAVPWSLYQMVRSSKSGREGLSLGLGLLLLAALFPPLWAIVSRAVLYDNMRHFIFVLPPLFCLSGMAFASFLATPRLCRAKWLPVTLLVLALGYATGQMASLHPYEYTYLNAFAGGMPEGGKRFETDYWVTSYREAAAIVETHAREVAKISGIPFAQAQFTVALVASPHSVEEILPKQFKLYEFDYVQRADYLVATTRWGSDAKWSEYPVIGTVARRGMVFAVVKASPDVAALVEGGGKSPP